MPAKQAASGTPGYANNTPGTGSPTILDGDVLNTWLAEITNVILAAGITLDPTNNSQLLEAIRFIGFPTGLNTLSATTTLTAVNAGTYYNVGGTGTTQTLNSSTFAAGQTVGFLAQSAFTLTASSGEFYGGSLAFVSSVAVPANSLLALQWDGVNWRQLAGSFLAIPSGEQEFSSSGTFTVPAGVTVVDVEVWGAGGGGGGSSGSGSNGSSGGGGGYSRNVITGLTPGTTIAATIGVGGTGGSASPTNGTSGGTSSFGSYLSATGGTFGAAAAGNIQNSAAGTPGSGVGGTINLTGVPGGFGFLSGSGVIGSVGGSPAFGFPPPIYQNAGSTAVGNAGGIGAGGNGGLWGGAAGAGGNGLIIVRY